MAGRGGVIRPRVRPLLLETDLADGATQTTKDGRGLTYPGPAVPAPGEAVEVARGVLWLRFALPFQLDHVNAYALADGDGWTVVDTGLRTREATAAWEAAGSSASIFGVSSSILPTPGMSIATPFRLDETMAP